MGGGSLGSGVSPAIVAVSAPSAEEPVGSGGGVSMTSQENLRLSQESFWRENTFPKSSAQ